MVAVALSTVDPVIAPIRTFDRTRDHGSPATRLEHVRRAARIFREDFLARAPALYYRTFDLIKVPYPTRYALRDACRVPVPYVHLVNRLFVVQFATAHGVKTLLAEPLDPEGNAQTPFFKRMASRLGGYDSRLRHTLYPNLNDVESCLERVGIRPADVDYITYDHLHTQDIRRWLGTHEREPVFPNAKLLVTRQEWESVHGLVAPQSDWYPPGGIEGVPKERVVLLDHDVMLGDSVALIRTPGHTIGNHSIVVHTDEGLLVTSENGVCPDAYAPGRSRIPGLRRYTEQTGMELVMNGNTLEASIDQYISMIQEREIAGPSPRNGDFYNIVCSSEMTAHWLSPGLAPSFRFGEIELGRPVIHGDLAPS